MIEFAVLTKGLVLASAIITSIIGALVYVQQPNKMSTFIFFMMTLALTLFFILATYYQHGPIEEYNWPLVVLMYALVVTVAVLTLVFSLWVGKRKFTFSPVRSTLILIPYIAMLFILVLYPQYIVAPMAKADAASGLHVIYFGQYYLAFLLFFGAYMTAAFVVLLRKYLTSAGIFKSQIHVIVVSVIVWVLSMYYLVLIAPAQGQYGYYWFAPLVNVFAFLSIAYAMARYNQWNIKYLGTQLFSVLIIIVLFLELLSSRALTDEIINGIVFVAVCLASYYLVRSVKQEVDATSEIDQLVKDLAHANENLQTLDDRKSEFVIMAAHHLKGPLTLIKGYASMLLEGSYGKRINKKATEAIQKIFDSSNRLIDIIGDFMDISNIESGEMDYVYESVDMRTLVEGVIEEIQPNIKGSNLKFSFDYDADARYMVRVDRGKLRQVVSNLIDNALKYTLQGSISVLMTKERSDSVVRVAITDTGVGMDEETLDKLFKKFSRATGISRLHTGGSGLGLYVARQILRNHNGRIWAESEGQGKGSSFFIEVNAMAEKVE